MDHLRDCEGFSLTGYVPDGPGVVSGVTVATGVDLLHQSEPDLRSKGVGPGTVDKLRPYLGKTPGQLDRRPESLRLTQREADDLDSAFYRDLEKRTAPYSKNVSSNGKAVLNSLAHWCWTPDQPSPDGKVYVSGCPNYVGDAVRGRQGGPTDRELKTALTRHKECAGRQGSQPWMLNRLQKEIDML